MVITVEPGIYIEDEGIGIRIEDDVLVTEKGHRNLSEAIVKEIAAIEELMALNP
jgi:Xaa-Pro aminopeptidase